VNFEGYFAIDRESLLRRYRAEGLRVLGYVCPAAPEEIFRSNGFVPIRIAPRYDGSYGRADRYLPACVCSHGRSMLSGLIDGRYDDFDAFFFASNCTTIRCLQYHFQRRHPERVLADFIVPTKALDPQAQDHLRREVKRLDEALRATAGGHASAPLAPVMATYRENRRLLGEVSRLRRERPGLLSAQVVNELYEYNAWVDKETANPKIAAFVEEVAAAPDAGARAATVFVLGNCCGNTALLEVLDRRGCRVVGDLVSTGEMTLLDVPEGDDPYAAIAARLDQGIPCPSKVVAGPEHDAMVGRVQELVRRSGADGVVLARQKFCDPHALERPFLLPRLKELGLPLLEIETELDLGNIEQIHTRIEAYLEMLA
jgi:benzoyl-CoA reductase/2-hydroxyglutaryl-CoA dehydratase subunit BcrC/BadD/HgdB